MKPLLRQYKLSPIVGAIHVQFSNSMFYVTVANTFMIATTLWTVKATTILGLLSWMNFWIFCAVAVVLVVLVMVLDYILVLPSRIEFMNYQACIHPNPGMDKLNHIESMMAVIGKRLGVVMDNDNQQEALLCGDCKSPLMSLGKTTVGQELYGCPKCEQVYFKLSSLDAHAIAIQQE